LKRGGSLIREEELATIRAALSALETVKQVDDHRAIRARIAEAEQATHHLAEVLMDDSLKQALQNKKLSELP